MAKVLVTGSEGSLMQAVIPKLLEMGHDIVGVDNLSRHGKRGTVQSARYKFVQCPAEDHQSINNIFTNYKEFNEPIEYVIQGAATIFGVGGFNKHCADILSKDLDIQSNMLTESVKAGVKKFIYISSSMVYENCPAYATGNKEDEPAFHSAPLTDYGLSKFVGERLCSSFKDQYGLDYLIWRPFNILTPLEIADNSQGYNHVFADFIDQLIGEKVEELPILGDGKQVRCFTWIDDVAKVIAENSFKDTVHRVYNIGTHRKTTMVELAEMIHDIAVKKGLRSGAPLKFKEMPAYRNDVRWRMPDITRITQEFDFIPSVTLEHALEECVMYYVRSKIKW